MVGVVMAVTLVVASPALAAGGPPDGRGRGAGSGVSTGEPLTDAQVEALTDFLLDEHKALATYEAVMDTFGTIEPFASIAAAEERHIAALERVFTRYGVALPEVPSFDVPAFETPEAAAEAAAQAEIDNAALYDRLTATFTQADVLRVMENLSRASLENHLPAFEAFANGEPLPAESHFGTGAPQGGRGMRGAGAGGQGRTDSDAGPRGAADCDAPFNAEGRMQRGRWAR